MDQLFKKLGFEKAAKPLSPKERETVYAAAYGMYEVGDYVRAAKLFTQLVLCDPFELRFWKGLASSRQMNREYPDALHAWGVACLLDGSQSLPHFHAAECYLSLGELSEAAKALECAKTLLGKSDPLALKIAELQKAAANA